MNLTSKQLSIVAADFFMHHISQNTSHHLDFIVHLHNTLKQYGGSVLHIPEISVFIGLADDVVSHDQLTQLRPSSRAALFRRVMDRYSCGRDAAPALIVPKPATPATPQHVVLAEQAEKARVAYEAEQVLNAQREKEARALAEEADALMAAKNHESNFKVAVKVLADAVYDMRLQKLDPSYTKFVVTGNALFAEYRKELKPFADAYGVKLVLVGDKSTAAVVVI